MLCSAMAATVPLTSPLFTLRRPLAPLPSPALFRCARVSPSLSLTFSSIATSFVSVRRSADAMDFFSLEEDEVGPDVVPAPPPTDKRFDIVVDKDTIRKLDLSPAHDVLGRFGDSGSQDLIVELFKRTVGFTLKYERDDPFDLRELSELPDVRLWFVRLDAAYPWLPVFLDWRAGELARYAAMLVPHQMNRKSGIVYNPEALELFAMNKFFYLYPWLKDRKVAKPAVKLNGMLKMLGYSVSEQLYELIESYPSQ